MDHLGLWGLIPPLLTIVLALVTKDVIMSLFVGILSGTLIVAGGDPIVALMNLTDNVAGSLNDGWNIRIFLFCALLGALVGLLGSTGSAYAFGNWAIKKIKSKTGALIFTWVFGIIIFIDDYFNSLTIGTVMRPFTDRVKVSRAKLAYILDSTAAPVCVIAPISSWVVYIMSQIRDSTTAAGEPILSKLGVNEFTYFINSIPYNLYAIFAIIMVLIIILTKVEFGPMARSEVRAEKGKGLFDEEKYGVVAGKIEERAEASKAKAVDMLFPIILLIVLAVIFFPVTTWFFSIDGENITTFAQSFNSIGILDAFNDTDASMALFYAIIFTLFITYIYYIIRRLITIKKSAEAIVDGIKSMVPALIILTLAWTIGGIIKSSPADGGLGLSRFLSEVVVGGGFPLWLLPIVVFVISCLISFSTGTSWGTFAIMMPIVLPISYELGIAQGLVDTGLLNATFVSVGAVLGGAIFGDHSSPISDTTILSSTGASCPHLEHVSTQLPYAIFVAISALFGYLISGLTYNWIFGMATTLVIFIIGLFLLNNLWGKSKFNTD